ncbi:MAG TPA: hypothetical protein VNY84_04540 [Acidimicrobiales bacterium]|nr:hypothetical protein [Acidimicrobiales bacterium]
MILEAGANAVTVKFHPRLTVITGVERSEREQMVAEILGALAGGRSGTDMELVDDQGKRMALIRPADGHDRIIAADSGEDLTEQFADADGRIDLLARMGLSVADARRRCHVTAAKMAGESQADAVLTALASVDQSELWTAAEQLVAAAAQLETESSMAGAHPEDAEVIEEIERRQAAFEAAEHRHKRIRRRAIRIAALAALAAIPAALFNQPIAGIGLMGVVVVATVISILLRRRTARAATAQREALGTVGAESYFGFQLQRVDRMLDGPKGLTRMAEASEAHRTALESWQVLAGEIDPVWAQGERKAVELLAGRIKSSPSFDGSVDTLANADPGELAAWLAARQTALRRVGPSGESLPLILDEAFIGVEPDLKEWLLELVGRTAGSPQVIYLTDDPQVAVWARLEAISGNLSFIAPAPEPDGERVRPYEFASRRRA